MAINRDDIEQILDKLSITGVCAFAVNALGGFDLRVRAHGKLPPYTEEEKAQRLKDYQSAVVGSTYASVRNLAFDELLRTSEHMTEEEFRTKFEL